MNETLVVVVYDVVAILGALLLVFVGRQAENDIPLKRLETPKLQWWRKVSFTAAELFLLFTVWSQGWLWEPSWIATGLIGASMMILGVNAISLNSRIPPRSQHGMRVPSTGAVGVRAISRVFHRLMH
jgi:hypothetical protein